jgi:P-type Ca2+ transporter type 2C
MDPLRVSHAVVAQAERAWMEPVEVVLEALETDGRTGLDAAEAERRTQRYGPNELEDRGGKHPLRILWEQFSSTMVLILIAAAVLSGFLGKPLETIAISAVVVLFAVLGFVQEYRAERAMAALRRLAVPTVRVRRDGAVTERSARELVPGDVVLLEAGANVPADLRLIESVNLRVEEAALTGESEAVEKRIEAIPAERLPLGDRVNMAYLGTSVAYGRGAGVVVATGMSTELGRVAALIGSVELRATPLQRQLDRLGKQLALFGVTIAALLSVVGVLRGEAAADMLLIAVSVAVAVVPEGLPAVVTVTLALGAQRMLRRRALIRKLPAVETLGAVTTICSDKTGTLTQKRMTVTVVDVAGHSLELVGAAPGPAPAPTGTADPVDLWRRQPPSVALTLAIGATCNDASLRPDPATGRYLTVGDPTEGALLVAAHDAGLERSALQHRLPRVAEFPFDSGRKRMTTVHRLPPGGLDLPEALASLRSLASPHVVFTKGAVDGLLGVCGSVWLVDRAVALDDGWRDRIRTANDQMAANGMRVLGLALRPLDDVPPVADEGLERELTFVGLVGMIDPPRPEVREAIEVCRGAGIRPIMITGDHPLTARFIAYDLGIARDGRVKTGADLDRMTSEELTAVVAEVSVYARVTPEHKLRIVDVLQARGEVVAMTGDGVNDSPALKKADIGVAMGIAGTDVAKEAAQMVLLDDNFATIVAAVEEGRGIYANLRRFVLFSVAGNVGKVLVMLLAPLMGVTVALQPLQLLWLNLLTDGLLGIGLGMEPAGEGAMRRPPRRKDESFLSGTMLRQIGLVGVLIGLLALGVGYVYVRAQGLANPTWQTMIFTSLAFMQIGQALAARSSERSLFALGLFTNPALLVLVAATFLLQLAALYLPFLEGFFRVTPLAPSELLVAVGMGVLVFVVLESQKAISRGRARAPSPGA